VNGRGIRLPTIVVRAGLPNAATTGCFSGVIREPLSGVDVVLPIASDVPHAVTSKRAAINGMITLHDTSLKTIEEILGFDRVVFLPAVALSLGDLEEALLEVVKAENHSKLGKITYEADARLSAIVGSFPTKINANRAMKLGILDAPDAQTLVREYMQDFSTAVADGIEANSETLGSAPQKSTAKVAVVTGGGSGIGRAFAERLSRGGWTVVLAGRRLNTLKETAALLGECMCVKTDVSVEAEVESLFQTVESKYGRVDLLFNNAGINSAAAASFENVTTADFERVMKTNVTGPFLCARAAMRIMAKNGNGGGRIVNNGSISAQVPRPGSACYTASKHALLGLTKIIALDGRAINVACGQIDFGNVVSEMSLATNMVGSGAMQPSGERMIEPSMSLADAAETFWTMVNLPLEANILQMTVMATKMPFVGRG
jgi:NAD(P)-dependent dehydrogenase (short-subunit alcohol dehydrogenase family)